MGKVAGGAVTEKVDPSGGCSFAQDDPRAPTIGSTLVAGGEDQQAQGGLANGQDIVLVTVIQGNGIAADKVRSIAVDAMGLAAA